MADSTPLHGFLDAAPDPQFLPRLVLGLRSTKGTVIHWVPVWVDTQQSAELYGVLAALA